MHHPPFDIGLSWQVELRIKDPQFFAGVIDWRTIAQIPLCHVQPACTMILLRPDETTIHFHDYPDQNAITEMQSSDFELDLPPSGSTPINASATAGQ